MYSMRTRFSGISGPDSLASILLRDFPAAIRELAQTLERERPSVWILYRDPLAHQSLDRRCLVNRGDHGAAGARVALSQGRLQTQNNPVDLRDAMTARLRDRLSGLT